MPFKLSAISETFKTDVVVFTPNDKCGHDKSKFVAIFERSKMSDSDRLATLEVAELLREKLVGWEHFLDEDNAPVDFNFETLGALLEVPEAVSALGGAYWQAFRKQDAKNSKR